MWIYTRWCRIVGNNTHVLCFFFTHNAQIGPAVPVKTKVPSWLLARSTKIATRFLPVYHRNKAVTSTVLPPRSTYTEAHTEVRVVAHSHKKCSGWLLWSATYRSEWIEQSRSVRFHRAIELKHWHALETIHHPLAPHETIQIFSLPTSSIHHNACDQEVASPRPRYSLELLCQDSSVSKKSSGSTRCVQ